MTTNKKVIPAEDYAFFEAIKEVFDQYPNAKERYAIASLNLRTRMGIDSSSQVGLSRIEGKQIITSFVNHHDVEPLHMTCTLWNENGDCLDWQQTKE